MIEKATIMKRLFLDIETCPNIGYFWSAGYKVDISYQQILVERRIITAAYMWEHEDKVHTFIWDKDRGDEKLVRELVEVMNEADEIVAHYGDGFDIPWVKARALRHGIVVPKWKTIDTKAWASRHFYFNSNKLDYLAAFLGIGTKIRTDYDLWKDATGGSDKQSKAAVEKMRVYNEHDVVLLKDVYTELSKYCPLHTHVGVLNENPKWSCPRCGTDKVRHVRAQVSQAGTVTHQMHCRACPRYYMVSQTAYSAFLER